MRLKLLLAGDGGQGIQTIADIICNAAFNKGLHVSFIPNYGLEQRGGVSLAFIQISDKEIGYPKFIKSDIMLVMSEQARERTKRYWDIKDIKIFDIRYYKEILAQKNIQALNQNIFFLGVLAKELEEREIYKFEELHKSLEVKLSKKFNWEENRRAFEIGFKNNLYVNC